MKTFERANSTKSSTATGCGVLPADTVARSLTGNPAFARFATTGAGHSMCPGAMSAAFNATPSRKTLLPFLSRGTGLQLRHSRLLFVLLLLAELGELPSPKGPCLRFLPDTRTAH